MSIAASQPTSIPTSSLGQSTKVHGHMDGAPSDGGFAAPFAAPTLVGLPRLFLARPDTHFYQREPASA